MTSRSHDRIERYNAAFYEVGLRLTQARLSAQALEEHPKDSAARAFLPGAVVRLVGAIHKLPPRFHEANDISTACHRLSCMGSVRFGRPREWKELCVIVGAIADAIPVIAQGESAVLRDRFKLGLLIADGTGSIPDEPILRDPVTGEDRSLWAGPPGYSYMPVYHKLAQHEALTAKGTRGSEVPKLLVETPKPQWKWRRQKDLRSLLKSLNATFNSFVARYSPKVVANEQILPGCPPQFWKWRLIEAAISGTVRRTQRLPRGRPKSRLVKRRRRAITEIIDRNDGWKRNPRLFRRQLLDQLRESKDFKETTVEVLRKDLDALGFASKRNSESTDGPDATA